MKKQVLWVLAAALSAALLLPACGKDAAENEPVPQIAEEDLPPKVENEPAQEQELVQPDDVIVTPYGELKYPGMWTDRVRYEMEEDGADVKVHFYATAEGAQVQLFTLCYGTVPEDGYEMGQLLIEGDMVVPVSTVMYSIVPQDDWSEETTNELYALQESINDLLVQLQEDPDFSNF